MTRFLCRICCAKKRRRDASTKDDEAEESIGSDGGDEDAGNGPEGISIVTSSKKVVVWPIDLLKMNFRELKFSTNKF
jgi:hypothetical protein